MNTPLERRTTWHRTPEAEDRHPQLPATIPPRPPLWADGGFRLRVSEPGQPGAGAAEVPIDRPFALVGRREGADVQIDDRHVSGRHLYLHLDRRGLFWVDLATRTGTRADGRERPSGWLRPGGALEVAGRRIELVECRVRDALPESAHPPADPLADAGALPLARVTLYPNHPGQSAPRALGSELVFLGRGVCCGVRVEGASASRTHCVLVRGAESAFLVDLIGRGTWLNGLPFRGAGPLADGDALMVGSAQFEVRIEPPSGRWLAPRTRTPTARPPATGGGGGDPSAWPSFPADAQGTILAMMMGQLQAQQGEAMRRQSEFQQAMTGLLRQMQDDQATLLSRHLERTEEIHRELAALREELARQVAPPPPPGAPKPPPLRIVHAPPAQDPAATTSWLIGRINQLEEESRSSWKDVLGRLTGTGRNAP